MSRKYLRKPLDKPSGVWYISLTSKVYNPHNFVQGGAHMSNEEIKRDLEEMMDALSSLTREELILARGFILGLQANQAAV